MTADQGSLSLMEAISGGDFGHAESIISQGAELSCVDASGRTPLHLAAMGGPHDFREVTFQVEADRVIATEGRSVIEREELRSYAQIARLLLSHSAPVDAVDSRGRSPLLIACELGHTEVTTVLLSHGADVNLVDGRDRTPLLIATRNGFLNEIQMLLAHGAEVNVRDKEGLSPLSLALEKRMVDTARLIIEKGARIEADKLGESPALHLAVALHEDDLVMFLLDRGADVNSRGVDFRTALHWAAMEGRIAIGAQLIDRGAMVDALDRYCTTPLGVATQAGHLEFVEMLRARGATDETGSPGSLESQYKCEGMIWVLRDSSAEIRGYTADALGKHGDRRAVLPLIRLLDDAAPWPRQAAAEALGKIGDPRAAPALLPLLKDPEEWVRAAVATSLGELGDPSAIAPLLDALSDESDYVRGRAVDAIAVFRDPGSIELLAACLSDPAPWVRLQAARALIHWRDPRATATLEEFLTAGTFVLRRGALTALTDLGWTAHDEPTRVAAAVAGGDWECTAAAGAAAARPLRQVLREADYEFGVDQVEQAADAERARQALERVVSTSVAEIDTELLRELAVLEVEVSYPRATFSDATHTLYESVTLGDTRQIEKLAAEELARRGVTLLDCDAD